MEASKSWRWSESRLILRPLATHVCPSSSSRAHGAAFLGVGPAIGWSCCYDTDNTAGQISADLLIEMQNRQATSITEVQGSAKKTKAREIFKSDPYDWDWSKNTPEDEGGLTIYKVGCKLTFCWWTSRSSTGRIQIFHCSMPAGATGVEIATTRWCIYGTAWFDRKTWKTSSNAWSWEREQ